MTGADGGATGKTTRRILVTGAAQGLGSAIARHLASQGCRVFATDRDTTTLENSLAQRPDIHIGHCDVADERSVLEAVAVARETLSGLDGLVNNAALVGVTRAPAEQIPIEEFDQVQRVNLRGPWLMYRAVIPHLEAGGSIVNVTSETAFAGSVNLSHYVASKAGLVGLTRALAREAGARGVRVNAIAPGFTDTPGARVIGDPDHYDTSNTPLGRVARPGDMVGAVDFLLSQTSSFVTGQTLLINGGRYFS